MLCQQIDKTMNITFPQWDIELFLFLNRLHCPLLDDIMWYVSANYTFIPLYIFIVAWLCRKRNKSKSVLTIIGVALCILLADRISSGLIKPAFERLRPSHEPLLSGMVHTLRGYTGGRFGFVSSHAANHFAFAVYSLLLARHLWYSIGILLLAALIGYSRIYIGVHYPLDVLCGAALGTAIGLGMFYLIKSLCFFTRK
jgi:undecaprenyl-diphosphatase